MPFPRSAALVAGTLLLAATVGVFSAAAAPAYRSSAGTTTPLTAAPATTTTTTGLLSGLLGGGTTSSTSPSTTKAPPSTAASPATKPPIPPSKSADAQPPPGPVSVPPDAQKLIDSVPRTPGRTTAPLLAAIQPLVGLGMTPTDAAVLAFGQFPVGGLANYSDDWLYPRFSGGFHLHQGNDIFAATGVPVRAPFTGVARTSTNGLGGLSVDVTLPDGTYVYMAHMNAFAPILASGQSVPVHQGDVVAFVGATGDAAGGASHDHFEIHPKGGAAVDPKPYLDAWMNAAIAAAPGVIQAVQAARLPPAPAPSAATGGPLAGPRKVSLGPDGAQLWAAAVDPPGGTLGVATALVQQAAGSMSWAPPTPAPSPATGDALARAYTAPLLPAALRDAF